MMKNGWDAFADAVKKQSSEVVGCRFQAWDGFVYLCDSYQPGLGYWMTREDAKPEHRADTSGDWRRNVSERAIGASYHRIW